MTKEEQIASLKRSILQKSCLTNICTDLELLTAISHLAYSNFTGSASVELGIGASDFQTQLLDYVTELHQIWRLRENAFEEIAQCISEALEEQKRISGAAKKRFRKYREQLILPRSDEKLEAMKTLLSDLGSDSSEADKQVASIIAMTGLSLDSTTESLLQLDAYLHEVAIELKHLRKKASASGKKLAETDQTILAEALILATLHREVLRTSKEQIWSIRSNIQLNIGNVLAIEEHAIQQEALQVQLKEMLLQREKSIVVSPALNHKKSN